MRITDKFSVSMAVYIRDDEKHFRTAVESVVEQTMTPDEILIVVDGPITQQLDSSLADLQNSCETIRIIRLEKNMGHGKARQIGLENCRNELVALMDSDDISMPDRFEKQLECFSLNQDLAVVGGSIEEFIDLPEHVVGARSVPVSNGEIRKYAKYRCPMNQMTVMLKKSEALNAGGYIHWYCDEDYYLWIRMIERGCVFHNIPEALVRVRVGNDMYQRRGGWEYFNSERRLQGYMYNAGMITLAEWIFNVTIRFCIQVMIPNKVRGFLFQTFFRTRDRATQ